jgi:hypothetical protein
VRNSSKSLRAKAARARSEGDDADGPSAYSTEAEFSMSTTSLICFLCELGSSFNGRGRSVEVQERAVEFLGAVLHRVLGEVEVLWPTSSGTTLKVKRATVELAPFHSLFLRLRRTHRLKLRHDSCRDVLLNLFTFMNDRRKTVDAMSKENARMLFKDIVALVSSLFEHHCPLTKSCDTHTKLDFLKGPKHRTKRISQAKKADVRAIARETATVATAGQIVNVMRTVKRKRGEADTECSERAAKRFSKDIMYQYMVASKRMWSIAPHVNCSYDALRVDTTELQFTLFYNHKLNIGNWAPPSDRNLVFFGCRQHVLTCISSTFSRGPAPTLTSPPMYKGPSRAHLGLSSSTFVFHDYSFIWGLGDKEIRDLRHKTSSAGVAFTEKEREGWQSQLSALFRSQKVQTTAAKLKECKRVNVTIPRLATLDVLRVQEHQLKHGTGKVFADFDNRYLLETAVVDEIHGIVRIPQGKGNMYADAVPNLLVGTSDRQSQQYCAKWFQENKLQLNTVTFPDPSHCNYNSLLEALAKARYTLVVTVSIMIYNIAYGPFQKSAFFKLLHSGTLDISASLSEDDPLLVHFWPRIREELGYENEFAGALGRRRFLDQLPTMDPGCVMGPKASSARFHSVLKAHRFWKQTATAKLFVIVFVGVRSGWAKSLSDILHPTRIHVKTALMTLSGDSLHDGIFQPHLAIEDADDTEDAALPGSSSAVAVAHPVGGEPPLTGGSSSSGLIRDGAAVPAAPEATPSRAAQLREAKEATDKERARSENTLHAVARLMSNDDLMEQVESVNLAANNVSLVYGDCYHEMRGPAKTREWYSNWAHWSACLILLPIA